MKYLGTVFKKLSDIAETDHVSVFWAKTAKNEVKKYWKSFRVEIWREIWNFDYEKFQKQLLYQNELKFHFWVYHSIGN